MTVFINGEIYIKNGPEIFHMDDESEDLMKKLELGSIDDRLNELMERTVALYSQLKNMEGTKDYSYCDEFWIANVEENGVNMVEAQTIPYMEAEERFFTDKKELDRTFTRLLIFLNEAQYVGRYFKRTKPIEDNHDKSFMENNQGCLALYTDGKKMLVKCKDCDGTERYEMIHSYYLEDGNYDFYGEHTDAYKDKMKVYTEINQQIIRQQGSLKR